MNFSLQSNLPNQILHSKKNNVNDPGEHFLLASGTITKSMAKAYSYLPFGFRIKRKIERRFEIFAENHGYEPVQLPSLVPLTICPERYHRFQCHVSSPYLKNLSLISRSEDSIGQLAKKIFLNKNGYSLWLNSREWRASGGSSGFLRSIEYENLVAYRAGFIDKDKLVNSLKKIVILNIEPLISKFSWTEPYQSRTGEYTAQNLNVHFKDNTSVLIGQVCIFSRQSAIKLKLIPAVGENTVACASISINRLVYALGRYLSEHPQATWPCAITPYHLHLIVVSSTFFAKAENLCTEISKSNIKQDFTILIDDRRISVGKKLFDADLLRLPFRIVLGNSTCIGFRAPGHSETKIPWNEAIIELIAFLKGENN